MWPKGTAYARDYAADARAQKIAHATMLRQLAKGTKKKLTRSEERTIIAASQRTR